MHSFVHGYSLHTVHIIMCMYVPMHMDNAYTVSTYIILYVYS